VQFILLDWSLGYPVVLNVTDPVLVGDVYKGRCDQHEPANLSIIPSFWSPPSARVSMLYFAGTHGVAEVLFGSPADRTVFAVPLRPYEPSSNATLTTCALLGVMSPIAMQPTVPGFGREIAIGRVTVGATHRNTLYVTDADSHIVHVLVPAAVVVNASTLPVTTPAIAPGTGDASVSPSSMPPPPAPAGTLGAYTLSSEMNLSSITGSPYVAFDLLGTQDVRSCCDVCCARDLMPVYVRAFCRMLTTTAMTN
jgi:hypothetical protein